MASRQNIADAALGSLRAEGLQPSAETQAVIESWIGGEIGNDDLEAAAEAIVAAATTKPAASQ